MKPIRHLLAAGALALAALPNCAFAQPGNSTTLSGTAQAELVDPGRLLKVADLRFGAFVQPTTAATMTVTPAGNVSATGEVASTMAITQPASGRGPAIFRLDGTQNRAFVAIIPNSITITSGGASMQVSNITSNTLMGINRFDASGTFYLRIGGRLNVNAMQQPGNYAGDFPVTVIFL